MNKKKHYPKHIYDDTFKLNFYISYGVTKKVYIDAVKRVVGVHIEDSTLATSYGKCSVFQSGDSEIIWVWTERKNIPALAHEFVHAVQFGLGSRGLHMCEDNDEVFAYLLERLMKETV